MNSNNSFVPFQGKTPFQGQGYQKQPINNYQAPMPSAPPAPVNNSPDALMSMMQSLLANQQKSSAEMNARFESNNAKIDGMYNTLNTKFEALSSHVKKLDTQVSQTVEAVKRSQETHTGKSTAQSQVAHVHAITCGTDVVLDDAGDTTDAEQSGAAATVVTPVATPIPARVYTPRVPYPRPTPKTPEEISIRFEKIFEKLKVEFPSEEVQKLPIFARCIDRRAVSHCSIDDGVRMVAEEVRAALKEKLPKAQREPVQSPKQRPLHKAEDPGKFIVPCTIAGVQFANSLVDSGSCVNIMPRATAEQLGITKLIRPPNITLGFANHTTTTPYGMIPDLHVGIGDYTLCVDFQIVEMERDAPQPLLLGRPFMATVGAVQDMSTRRMTFMYIDKNKSYTVAPTVGPVRRASSITFVDAIQPLGTKRDIVVVDSRVHTKEPGAKGMVKRVSRPFAKISIIIPTHLRDKGADTIKELLKDTMSLFPDVRAWQIKDGALAAVGKNEGPVSTKVSKDTGDPHLLGGPPRA